MSKFLPLIFIFYATWLSYSQIYINEVDYDQPGTDATEFIELVGPINTSLDGYTVELVNGYDGSVYKPLDLSGYTIPNDNIGGYGFFVIGPANGVTNVDFVPSGWVTNQIQNGSPDGILIKLNGTVVDGFSYEGAITNNSDFTSGMAINAEDAGSENSIGRITLGFDLNDQDLFFAQTVETPSPGEQNSSHGQNLTGGAVPIIQNVLEEPFPASQPFSITCDVTISSGTVDSVYLYHYTDFNQVNLDSLHMYPAGGDSYTAGLPGQSNGVSLTYWVKAWGNGISSTSEQKKVIIGIPDIGIFHSQLDANGLPLHLDHLTRLRGIVTVSSGIFSVDNYDFYMQDNTGGINIFDFDYTADSTQYQQGDSLEIVGIIDVYNGKVEIVDFEAIVLSSSNPLPAPIDLNIEDMGEEYESRLISIDNVTLVSGSWLSAPDTSYNLTINDGSGDLTLRIVGSTDIGGNPEPSWPITLVGIGGQYDFSSPYLEGYQIQPRSFADFITTSISGEEQFIHEYRLSQNYPNPFNPETRIQYSLKKAGQIDFRVLNILGQEVYRLTANKPAGSHELVFDGRELPSGIYFYQLKAGKFKEVLKMVLSR